MLSRVREMLKDRSANYPYVTARVRALKTHLLPPTEYPKLIQRSVNDIARSLEEGRYKEEVDELASEYSGCQLIERATRLQMGREFRDILSWCKGEPRRLLELYFHRYEVHNIKTVLRGVRSNADQEEIRLSMIPAGVEPERTFLQAASSSTLEEAIQALKTTAYGETLRGLAEERLSDIENALDVAYYTNLTEGIEPRDKATEAFHAFLKQEADIVNLKLILRAKHSGVDDYELVPGGKKVTEDLARRVRGAEWSEVPSILEETPFGPVLREALRDYQETQDLNTIASELDRYHLEEASGFGHRYPLSILPLIDYVLRKESEVDRVRIIAVGKVHELTREEIEALVGL